MFYIFLVDLKWNYKGQNTNLHTTSGTQLKYSVSDTRTVLILEIKKINKIWFITINITGNNQVWGFYALESYLFIFQDNDSISCLINTYKISGILWFALMRLFFFFTKVSIIFIRFLYVFQCNMWHTELFKNKQQVILLSLEYFSFFKIVF